MLLVYRYRVKSLTGLLSRQARACNFVWNFCNDTQKHALKWYCQIRHTLRPMQTQRHIRSFVLRAGRMTAAQERALKDLWPSYGVDLSDDPLDLEGMFGRRAPRCLEIGFGAGEGMGSLAEKN